MPIELALTSAGPSFGADTCAWTDYARRVGIFSKASKSERSDVSAVTVVYFAADERKLARMDVALGPCVAAEGQKNPIVSPLSQDRGETPEQSEALFTVLTGRPSTEAFDTLSVQGRGTLFRCSAAFVDALADASQAMLAMRDDEGFMEERERISLAWMQAIAWPDHYVSLVNRLDRLHGARVAREEGLAFYCWAGPSVPMRTLVSGTGPYPGKG